MNKPLFNFVVAQKGDKLPELSEALGVHIQTMYLKLKNETFKQREIRAIIERYNLSDELAVKIFFKEG